MSQKTVEITKDKTFGFIYTEMNSGNSRKFEGPYQFMFVERKDRKLVYTAVRSKTTFIFNS